MLVRGILLIFFTALALNAQKYDLVLRGGHVLDPASGMDAVRDVAVAGNKIAAVEPHIAPEEARQSLDVSGLYVVPGLVDLHAHVFGSAESLPADDTALPTGSTTIVDAGGSGWRTFDRLRGTVAARSKTRVLALINIVGAGMVGEPAESNTEDMDPAKTAETIRRNRDIIVGIKTAHFGKRGYTAIDRAVEAGRLAAVPVMVDDKIFTNTGRTTSEELLDHLRPGDIHTHMYNDRQIELLDRFTGKVQPYMLEARRRGVRFDMGHGAGSFLWPVATRAMAQGFLPDTISTDLHAMSILGAQSDMPNCMSKMLLLGMSLPEAVRRATVTPAQTIGRYPELGTLGVGRTADIAVLDLEKGVFALKDSWGAKRLTTQRLHCVLTVRDGKLVYDPDGRALGLTSEAPRASPPKSEIYDLLLKNGRVIDPTNHRVGRFDVAVIGKQIARVAQDLPAAHARVAVDASQYYITPGLIEIRAQQPDCITLPRGVTTALTAAASDREPRLPDTISSGILSKSLSLGQTVEQVIERATVNAARAAHRPDLGTLREGAVADIAVLALENHRFAFVDGGQHRTGERRVRCILTVRQGLVVWDSEGLTAPDWIKSGPYSNFR